MNAGDKVRMKHSGPSTDRQMFTFVGVTAHDAQTATLLREDGKTISVDVASIEIVAPVQRPVSVSHIFAPERYAKL